MATNGVTAKASAGAGRGREGPSGDEEATTRLKLGEFEGVPTLSLSEAKVLIDAVKEKRRITGSKMKESEILHKTEDYLDIFARFQNKEIVSAVEAILGKANLAMFERSQLGSLCCESPEEAKTLVPSIADKITDEELGTLLDDVTRLRFEQ